MTPDQHDNAASPSDAVIISSITQASDDLLSQLTEISMKGNRYDLSDQVLYKENHGYFRNEFANFNTAREVFIIATRAGRVVGFARAEPKPSRPSEWWLNGIEVCEEHRNQGIGTRMAQTLVHHLRQRDVHCLVASIAKRNIGSLTVAQRIGMNIVTDVFETFDGDLNSTGRTWLLRAEF